MATVFYVVLFVLGLAAGSFLNVLTLRYKPERSAFSTTALTGRSHCTRCGKTLGWLELIPLVSFMIQMGRCRSCGARLTLQYPLVELASGAAWVAMPLFLGSFYNISAVLAASFGAPRWYYGLALLWIFAFLVWLAIFVIDLRHYLIPNELNLLLAAIGALAVLVVSVNHGAIPVFRDSFLRHYALLASPVLAVWLNHLLGAAAGGVIFWFLALVGRGRAMGMGDVKLALASGILLGWPDIVFATVVAFIAGGAWGMALMLMGKKSLGDKLPFAPFFVFGVAATVFCGYDLLRLYFSLFGL